MRLVNSNLRWRAGALAALALLGLTWPPGNLRAQFCTEPHWQQFPGTPAMPFRSDFTGAMAYDSHRAQTLLFGGKMGAGSSEVVYNDTWEFDGTSWAQRNPPVSPPRLVLHAMSFDVDRRVTVLFGGLKYRDDGSSEVSNETWEWDGRTWKLIPMEVMPTRHSGHAMVYDSIRKVHVLYGGVEVIYDQGQIVVQRTTTDTWEYDGRAHTWTLRASGGPSARSGFSMAYDSIRGRTLLFGGLDGSLPVQLRAAWLNDTWIWHGESAIWERVYPSNFNTPSPRINAAMAFDPRRGVVVLRGGKAPDQFRDEFVTHSSYETDTWEWNGSLWENNSTIYGPSPAAYGQAMVFETAREQLLLLASQSEMTTWRATTGNGNPVNYVNSAYQGFNEDGSPVAPFRMIRNALPCTIGTGTLIIRAGDYPEGTLTLTKQMRLSAELGLVRIH